MKLNNSHFIQQSLSTTVPEVEVLYWLVEDALHEGNKDKAELLFQTLLYIAKYNAKLISQGLRPIQRERLKEITHEIHKGISLRKVQPITMKPPIEPRSIPFKKEKELQHYLHDNKKVLEDALSCSLRIIGLEVETADDYRCDIVAESENTCFPIELKIAQSTHAVVSQCSKYCYYFYRKLRYGQFKEVQGVVVSRGFDAWSINELRRHGHWIFNIVPISDSDITLEWVH